MAKNILYYGDNLDILRRHIPDESVDLIYLDPPFNSSRNYNVLFRESNGTDAPAQIRAFEDSWTWNLQAVETLEELMQTAPPALVSLLQSFVPFLGHSPMMAYLVMMAIRLMELRRVLKHTGSIYLHCDPVASHYLKVLMDAIFTSQCFQREIVWRIGWVSGFKTQAQNWIRNHETILYYSKSDEFVFNKPVIPYREDYRRRDGSKPSGKGIPVEDTWNCHPEDRSPSGEPLDSIMIKSFSQEKLGYPTQKPLALLERIIQASSNEGDVVLDPFCGCGTTVDAAHHLGRQWIGIDITHLAVSLIRRRLWDRYGEDVQFDVVGEPKDEGSARALAKQDRYQFQSWALDQIDARPAQEVKGSDRGIDGVRFFSDDGKMIRRVLVQVKSGHVGVNLIRDLVGTLNRENDDKERTPIGIFVTLEQPTQPMISEAASAGFYRNPLIPDKKFPRLQILTVRDLFEGKKPDLPHSQPFTYTKAGAAPKMKTQEKLNL